MSITNAVATLLAGNDSLNELVQNRIHEERVPAGSSYPCLVLQLLDDDDLDELSGKPDCGTAYIQIDIETEGDNARKMRERVARLVLETMRGYRGTVEYQFDGVAETLHIYGCSKVREDKASAKPDDGSDNWTRRHSFDFRITHSG